jgi:hypothetical protein
MKSRREAAFFVTICLFCPDGHATGGEFDPLARPEPQRGCGTARTGSFSGALDGIVGQTDAGSG